MAIDEQNLPELVKEVRRQLGISQEDLARELGVSFATVNRWENGKSKPSKLARKLILLDQLQPVTVLPSGWKAWKER